MKNLFYSSVFIFFVSLLFVGCTNESEDNTSTEEFKYSSLKNILNTSTIEDELMLEKGSFIVDWNNPMLVEVNKKDFGNDTYMFKAESKGGIYKGENFLPATHWVIAKTKEGKTDLKIHRFEPYVNTITPNPSPLQKNGFNGLEFILSNTGKIDDILTYENGEVIASFLEIKKNEVVGSKSAKASSDEFDSCSDINYVCNPDETNNGSGGYQRVTVYVYVAWVNEYYDVHNNFTGYNVQSIKEESYTTWVYVGSSTSPAPIYNYEYRNVSTGAPIAKELFDNQEFNQWLKDFIGLPDSPCGLGHDCVKSIQHMMNGLRKFHGNEGALMADYFDNLLSDFDSFTRSDLQKFYDLAKQVTNRFNNYMYSEINTAFVEGATEVLSVVLFEIGGNAAIQLLQKIPVSWVYRGARLNNMVKNVGLLGNMSKSGNHIRVVVTNAPITKSKELFNSLTKHAISKVTESGGAIKANMGNGNFITYRPVTASQSGFPATISLNFSKIWSKVREVKFITK